MPCGGSGGSASCATFCDLTFDMTGGIPSPLTVSQQSKPLMKVFNWSDTPWSWANNQVKSKGSNANDSGRFPNLQSLSLLHPYYLQFSNPFWKLTNQSSCSVGIKQKQICLLCSCGSFRPHSPSPVISDRGSIGTSKSNHRTPTKVLNLGSSVLNCKTFDNMWRLKWHLAVMDDSKERLLMLLAINSVRKLPSTVKPLQHSRFTVVRKFLCWN